MTDYTKRVEAAISKSKDAFDSKCVFTRSKNIDGAHIVPRDFKSSLGIGKKFADNEYNIVPLSRKQHNYFDKKTPEQKIGLLKELAFIDSSQRPDREELIHRLERLELALDECYGDLWRDDR